MSSVKTLRRLVRRIQNLRSCGFTWAECDCAMGFDRDVIRSRRIIRKVTRFPEMLVA